LILAQRQPGKLLLGITKTKAALEWEWWLSVWIAKAHEISARLRLQEKAKM